MTNSLSPAQSRAARGLLNWKQKTLAYKSGTVRSTVANFETGYRLVSQEALAKIEQAFTNAGVEFIPGGVRFTDSQEKSTCQ